MNVFMLFDHAWLSALADHLWQSTLTVAVAWLLTLALRHAPARARFWVWMAASIKFLVPLALVSALAASVASWSHTQFVLPAHGTEHSAAVWMQSVSQPLQQRAFSSSARSEMGAAVANPWQQVKRILLPALVGMWLVGFVLLVLSWLRQWFEVRRLVRAAMPIELDLAAGIEVRLSDTALEPGIFGIMRPVLLLPEGVLSHLSEPQLRAVIEHELAHMRRRDNLTAMLHMGVAALFWFHPAVWWIRTRLLAEREQACDEAVLQSGNAAELYAESILSVCRLYVESPLPCLSGITGSDLKRRIVYIMKGEAPRALGMRRKLLLCVTAFAAVSIPVLPGLIQIDRVHAQAATSPAKVPTAFDVISIHVHKPGANDGMGIGFGDGKFDGTNVDLVTLFMNAYDIRSGLIFGIPAWAKGKDWDIHAKTVDPTPEEVKKMNLTEEQERQFAVNMLAERFHAKAHWETRELPTYDLVLEKNGPKFSENAAQNAADVKSIPSGGMSSNWSPTEHKIKFNGAPMKSLVFSLASDLNRDIIDQTGLTGKYSFVLKFTPQDAPPDSSDSGAGDAGPSIFTALQEQLGLKLVPSKGPVKVLVIDHVEMPTEN
ncbi:M56 family metallopeptidase [Silvibacterium dinghuense]|uniref:TIGR03435 family protein n=1 Tax=Silvibacterium dinghuense TaxID=1560006 RepID=A0A4Q1S8K7_9BACT|nr:M56 family metallopeptidase [Silvibacterium dinghuense]RXS93271.1 TIGR03435 family protein [Silvibacterium dinghuense]GGH04467.1 hypothetical protein GCM10011586_20600 [Silvibacterium dinghuense]